MEFTAKTVEEAVELGLKELGLSQDQAEINVLEQPVKGLFGKLKGKGSQVAGQANVLIFPDLNSGNIGYKLMERFGGLQAVGIIMQGFNKAINDLSRGCCVNDIVVMTAVTALQSQN